MDTGCSGKSGLHAIVPVVVVDVDVAANAWSLNTVARLALATRCKRKSATPRLVLLVASGTPGANGMIAPCLAAEAGRKEGNARVKAEAKFTTMMRMMMTSTHPAASASKRNPEAATKTSSVPLTAFGFSGVCGRDVP